MNERSESGGDTTVSIEETTACVVEERLVGEVRYLDRPSATRGTIAELRAELRTQRLQLLSQLQAATTELATAKRLHREVLAVLSHELRSPLAAIGNALYLLGRQDVGAAAHGRARALIKHQVDQMTQLADGVVEVSRFGNGASRLHRKRLDLRHVVQHAIETVESNVRERNHRLATTLPEAPVWLQADPGRLEQVFVNLLVNAAKYTDTGGDLRLSLQQEHNEAIVRVADSGIGIAPDILPRVFEPFWRVDPSTRHSNAGLGIGLALARKFVELHGGRLDAMSGGLGRGSEFTVRLPMA